MTTLPISVIIVAFILILMLLVRVAAHNSSLRKKIDSVNEDMDSLRKTLGTYMTDTDENLVRAGIYEESKLFSYMVQKVKLKRDYKLEEKFEALSNALGYNVKKVDRSKQPKYIAVEVEEEQEE